MISIQRMRFVSVVCLSLLALPQVHAQSIQGRVVAAESEVPVAGALVVVWSASGDTVRTLASANGRFRLQLPRGGAYSVRVLRIGFAPSANVAVTVPDRGDVSLDLRASVVPIRLDAVAVRRDATCGPMRPEAVAIASIWEEARKAMLSVQLDADGEPLSATWMEYERETDTTARIVRSQQVRVLRQPSRHVFTSVSRDSLVSQGFVAINGSEVRYRAPDPQLLLSSDFTAKHCFSLEPRTRASDEEGIVGLRFQPVDTRSTRYDIEGVVWVHAATGELRRIDFRYTNMPEASGIVAGGTVELARLAGGQWVVSRWRAQLPLVQRRPARAVSRMSALPGSERYVATGMHTTGGEVIRLDQNGTTVLSRNVPQLRLALTARDTLVDVAGAIVEVEGTNLRATTDSQGFVDLGPAPVGRYRIHLSFPRVDELVPPQLTYTVELRTASTVDTLALPTRAKLLESLCTLPNSARSDAGTGLLRGAVVTPDGTPAAGARVTIRFLRTDARAIRAGGARQLEQQHTLTTNGQGVFRACGIPRGADVTVEATAENARATWRGRLDPARLSQAIALRLEPATLALDSARATVVQPLTAVSVVGDRDSTRTDRPKPASGQHLTAEDIALMRVEHSWQLLARVTGVQLRRVGGAVYAVSSRGNAPSLRDPMRACPLQLMVNGALVTPRSEDGADLSELPPPERIERLDVYPSGAEIPVSMGSTMRGSWCGLVAVTLK
jgi:hypothetical protein